jgi:hypothetical protein
MVGSRMKSEEIVTTPPASAEPVPEEAMLYCPVCDQKLFQRKCKLLCGRCGYYMSCADYY